MNVLFPLWQPLLFRLLARKVEVHFRHPDAPDDIARQQFETTDAREIQDRRCTGNNDQSRTWRRF